MINGITQRAQWTLAKFRVQYDFFPEGDEVEVVRMQGRGRLVYRVSSDEARQLWLRLRSQGFERF